MMMPNTGNSRINDVSFYDPAKQKQAERQRLVAQALMQQGQTALGKGNEVVSGIVVEKSPIEGLAAALQTGLAGLAAGQAGRADDEAAAQRQRLYQEALGSTDPRQAAAILAQDPESLGTAAKLWGDALSAETAAATKADDRAWEMQKLERQLQNQREVANIRANAAQGGGQIVGEDAEGNPIYSQYSNKPLPVQALKQQQEAIDALAAATNISDNANAINSQIQSGQLDLGPFENKISQLRNWAGASTPNSQNFANLQTTLEKVRNDTLRLNKGVQTEGDAQRALNEVLQSVNDPKVLSNALSKLDAINQRAAELQRLNVNNIRQNYNAAPYDFEGVSSLPSVNQPSAQGQAAKIEAHMKAKGASPQQIQAVLGRLNGR